MEETNPMQPAENEELQKQVEANPVEETPAENLNDNQPNEAAPVAETSEEPAPEAAPAETDETAEPVQDYSVLDREGLLAALQELMTEEVQQIKGRAQAIRTRFNELNRDVQKAAFDAFLAEGGNKDDYQPQNDTLADEFYALYDRYRARRQQYLEELEQQKKKNLEAKQALIEELRVLVDSEEEQVRASLDRFNEIQERWKAIGDVPRDQMNDLWQNYHFHI